MWSALDTELVFARETRCQRDWQWDGRLTPPADFILWFVVVGKGRLTLSRCDYPLRPGDCFVVSPGQACFARHDPDHPLTVQWAHFRLSGDGRRRDCPPPHRSIEQFALFRTLFDRVIEEDLRGDAGHRAACAWFASLMLEMRRQDDLPHPEAPQRRHYDRLSQLCRSIAAEPGEAYCVEELAERFGCSPEHFSRLFRRVAGCPPRQFIMNARINAAGALLRVSNHSVTRIAELMGFSDLYHFSRRFREKTGWSPTAYRKGFVRRVDRG